MAKTPSKKAAGKQQGVMQTIKSLMDMRNAAARAAPQKRQPPSRSVQGKTIQNGGFPPSPATFGAGMGSPGSMTN